MLTLAVDTSSQAGSLAVLCDRRLLGVVSTCTDETYSSRLFRQLDFLLGELGLGLEKFDQFAVVTGPGSFTGLRVGLSAVKGWAEVYGRPVAAISALEAVAAQTQVSESLLVPVIDARRGQVYGAVYRRGEDRLVCLGDQLVMSPEEFLQAVTAFGRVDQMALVTPTPEVLAGSLQGSPFCGRPVPAVSSVLAPAVARLGEDCARRGELVDALRLDANYIRRSDAELLWKG